MGPHHHHHHPQRIAHHNLFSTFHIPIIKQVDINALSDWNQWDDYLDGLGEVFRNSIPGYHYSATFLTTLRTNLHLTISLSAPTATTAMSTTHLPLDPSPLQTLTTHPSTPATHLPALHLVADSIAQQRQLAAQALLLHPTTLSLSLLLLALLALWLRDVATLVTTGAGLVMAGLVCVRWLTGGYIRVAEGVGGEWLREGGGSGVGVKEKEGKGNGNGSGSGNGKAEEPIMVVTTWGGEVIGVVVIRFVKKERKGYVRAWTVGGRYRGKGVGRALLEEGVRVLWGRGGRGCEFDVGHANSYRALPPYFNRQMELDELRAREVLAEVVAEQRRDKRYSR